MEIVAFASKCCIFRLRVFFFHYVQRNIETYHSFYKGELNLSSLVSFFNFVNDSDVLRKNTFVWYLFSFYVFTTCTEPTITATVLQSLCFKFEVLSFCFVLIKTIKNGYSDWNDWKSIFVECLTYEIMLYSICNIFEIGSWKPVDLLCEIKFEVFLDKLYTSW